MADIANLEIYNERMKKSLVDKVFWLDRIDPDVIVDFGCGDGTLIEFISNNFPEIVCAGYDTNEEMLALGREKCSVGAIFTSNWEELKVKLEKMSKDGFKIALILNSVIHEVYSYGTEDSIAEFWKRVNDPIFKWICIRDMAISVADRGLHCKVEDLEKILRHPGYIKSALDFIEVWGSLVPVKNFIHFLLKYQYQENWERELHENYLPLSHSDILYMISGNFKHIYDDVFCLDFIRRQIKKDFDIELNYNTHMKAIFERT